MIGLLVAAVLSGTSATSTANLPGIETLNGSTSVMVSQSKRSSSRAWVPPNLSYDEDALCVPFLEKQIDGFGAVRIGRPCAMRKLPSASSAFSNDNGERGMQ